MLKPRLNVREYNLVDCSDHVTFVANNIMLRWSRMDMGSMKYVLKGFSSIKNFSLRAKPFYEHITPNDQ